MDLNDDLCRTDFFDFACPKLEPGANGLTPVAFIDSIDYVQTDGNNNLGGSTGHIKSFLDEILLTDSLHSNQNGESLQNGHNTFELLGTFQWSNSGGGENVSEGSPSMTTDPSPNWLLNSGVTSDGEVTTLTNLLDPLFVSYEDSKIDQYFISSNPPPENSSVISSDLISTTFLNENSGSPATSENDLIHWQKNSEVFCDESLLRSALQAGNKQQQITILTQKSVSASEMTELRKVLSFPPLTNGISQNTTSSPTSTEHGGTEGNLEINSEAPYYELKVLDPIYVDPDANIPNVEELIMTRIDPPFSGNGTVKKISEISEKKINSTTLSTKWTYATPSDQGKTPRRRNGKNKNGLKNHNSNSNDGHNSLSCILPNGGVFSPSGSPTNTNSSGSSTNTNGSNVSSNGNSRKERSLHYCNICCKGFKDKYSVNVHVRTHTGEKPFSCTLCGKNFRQKAHLAKHYQTHAAKGNTLHGKAAVKR